MNIDRVNAFASRVGHSDHPLGIEIMQTLHDCTAEISTLRARVPPRSPPMNSDDAKATSKAVPETHNLKCWPSLFQALLDGTKTNELRNDDRGFAVGDYLNLMEWDKTTGAFTGRWQVRKITHITRLLEWIPADAARPFVVMSLAPLEPPCPASSPPPSVEPSQPVAGPSAGSSVAPSPSHGSPTGSAASSTSPSPTSPAAAVAASGEGVLPRRKDNPDYHLQTRAFDRAQRFVSESNTLPFPEHGSDELTDAESAVADELSLCIAEHTRHETATLAERVRELEAQLDPSVCRFQFPDGHVPGNVRVLSSPTDPSGTPEPAKAAGTSIASMREIDPNHLESGFRRHVRACIIELADQLALRQEKRT